MAPHRPLKTRWAVRFLLFVAATFAAVALVLGTPWAGEQICATASRLLARLAGAPVSLDRCSIDPLASELVVEGIRIGDPAGEGPLLSLNRLVVDVAPLALGSAISIERLEMDGPSFTWALGDGEGGEGPGEGRERAQGDCLSLFDRVRVDEVSIRGARAQVLLPGGQAALREVDLEVRRHRRRYEAQVTVGGGAFESGGLSIPLDRLEAALGLDLAEERVDLASLRVRGLGASFEAEGEIADLCDPAFRIQALLDAQLAPIAQALAPELENPRGSLTLRATIGGTASAPAVEATAVLAEVAFDDFDLGTIELRASLAEDRLRLEELVWPIGEGRAIVQGELLLREGLPARVDVTTERLPFERLLARLPVKNTPVSMAIDSQHHLEGALASGLRLAGRSHVEIEGFRVTNEPWHDPTGEVIVEVPGRARLDTDVVVTATGVALDGARASFGKDTLLEIDAWLSFFDAEGLSIRVRSPRFDLAHIRSHVAGIPLAGVGQIAARIEGPYPDPIIEGDLDLAEAGLFSARLGDVRSHVLARPSEGSVDFRGFEGERGRSAYRADVRLLLGGEPTLEGALELREGSRLSDLFEATRDLAPPLAWLHENLEGRVTRARATVSGPLPDIRAEGTIHARDVRFLDRPFDTLAAELVLPGLERLQLSEVRLGRGRGDAIARGTIHFPPRGEASVDATVHGKELPLRDLLGSFGEWAELEGVAGAAAYVRGPIGRLEVGGEIFAERIASFGVELDPIRLSLETQGDQVIVRGPVAGAGSLSGAVRLAESLPFEATLRLDVPRLARYLPQEVDVAGRLTGSATARGTLASIADARGTVELDRLVLELAGYRLESQDRIRFDYAGDSFVLREVALRGENTELTIAGSRAVGGALDMRARGRFDARILDSLVPQIEHASGQVEMKAALTGRSERPVLVGSADVQRGAFRVKALPVHVQRFDGRLAFSQNQVVVEEASLLVNQGRSRLSGTISLDRFRPDRFDLTLDGERVSWRMPADWPAIVSGRLHLGGAWPDRLVLTGELTVDRLRYARDLDLERTILDFRQRVLQPPVADEEEWLRLDIDLVGGSDMRVENNLVRARLQFVAPPGGGRPRLTLVGTNARIGLLGAVEIVDGLAFFRGNEYRITHGVVVFDDRRRIDPEFDITAETDVRDYRVTVHAFGHLDEESGGFQLELASEPTLVQTDIVTLLTFGITSRDLDRGGNPYAGAGVAAEALLTVSGLDEQMRRWFSDSEVLRDPEFSVTSQYSEVTGQVEPMATFGAKLLGDRLRLQAAAPFSTARGRRASAEWRVNERLSTQLVWEDEETGYSAGDLGLDVKLRWEWE